MSRNVETVISMALVAAACIVAYKLGHRDKQNEARARGFIEGWNAAVDAIVPTLDDTGAWTSDVHEIVVSDEHRRSQLRNAQDGTQ